mmetsp:Transcript_16030/g.33278  ORF Transcript_16030/g.33278 Transcript_16030/m.33278 type:complete len:151 (-) Transcript_16030:436-888(-)
MPTSLLLATSSSTSTSTSTSPAPLPLPPLSSKRVRFRNSIWRKLEIGSPESFRYLQDCCNNYNPPVKESPDPLVSMTWTRTTTWNKKTNLNNDRATTTTTKYYNNDENDDDNETFVGIPLQIYRTRTPVKQWTIPSDGCLVTARTKREDN